MMEVELFFLFDKIVALGSIDIIGEKPSCIRELLNNHLNKVVIRKGYGGFIASLNSNLEAQILKIMKSDVSNKRQRIYGLLGIREPEAVDKIINRLTDAKIDSTGVGAGLTRIWLEISEKGHYCEHTDKKSFALDLMIFEGVLSYDDYGYYSMADRFIKKAHKDNELTIGKIKKLGIPVDPLGLRSTVSIMSELGYSLAGDSMKFIPDKLSKNSDLDLSTDGFMVG